MSSNANVFRWVIKNFFSKTQLDAGQLDDRYFTEAEHINTSAGAGDAGKPIKLDAGGHIDATMINDADVDHGTLGGLTDDDHTGYALLAGRSGGQSLVGGTASGNDLTLQSTSNATRGRILFGTVAAVDEATGRLGLGTQSPGHRVHVVGDNSTTFALIKLQNTQGAGRSWWLYAGAAGVAADFGIYDETATAYRLTIDSAGQVTIPGALAVTGNITQNSVAVVTISGIQTLTNKTLTSPTITTPTISSTGFTNATHAHTGTSSGGTLDHGAALTGLTDDDHTNYMLLAGRSSGQTLNGGNAANEDLTIYGTAHATKTSSYVLLNPTSGGVGVGTSDPGGANFVIGDGGAKLFIFDPDGSSSGPKLTAYDTGSAGTTTLEIAASVLNLNPGTKGLIFGANTTPSSASDTGTAGAFCWDSTHIYLCVATNTWKRVAISTF